MSDVTSDLLRSFDPGFAFHILNKIKLGAGTFLPAVESTRETEFIQRLYTCGMLSIYDGGPAKIATLTASGAMLHAFLSCWASTER